MKRLYILRGAPGSGKSTLARLITGEGCEDGGPNWAIICEADQFFTDTHGNYKFIPHLIPTAHEWCFRKAINAMRAETAVVVVSNTNTERWQFTRYIDAAKEFRYSVQEIVLLNRFKSIHNIPEDRANRMEARLRESLKEELGS